MKSGALTLIAVGFLACSACGSSGSGSPSGLVDASNDAADVTRGEASLGDAPDDAGSLDTGLSQGSLTCIQSDHYAAAEPCPSTGGPYTTFECNSICLEFQTLASGPTMCALGGQVDAGVVPYTDAGTLVLCCPGTFDASAVACWGPFM